jgi:hypothetical protein
VKLWNPDHEPVLTRLWRFGRALCVAFGALLTLYAAATLWANAADLPQPLMWIPLLVGIGVQFLGDRSFTFRAEAGRWPRQLALFLAVEVVVWGIRSAGTRLFGGSTAIAFLQIAILFVFVQYPARRLLVFRVASAGAELQPSANSSAPQTQSHGVASFLLPIAGGAALGVSVGVATAYQGGGGGFFDQGFAAMFYGAFGGLVGGATGTVLGLFLLLTRRG